MNDIINNPAHYAAEVGKEIDCLTAMHACVGDGEFAGHLRCQMFKYIWRFKRKLGADPIDDLRKAEFYNKRLQNLTITMQDKKSKVERKIELEEKIAQLLEEIERLNIHNEIHHESQ